MFSSFNEEFPSQSFLNNNDSMIKHINADLKQEESKRGGEYTHTEVQQDEFEMDYAQVEDKKNASSFILQRNMLNNSSIIEQRDEDEQGNNQASMHFSDDGTSQGDHSFSKSVTNSIVNPTEISRFSQLQKNPQFADQMKRLINLYEEDDKKKLKKEAAIVNQMNHNRYKSTDSAIRGKMMNPLDGEKSFHYEIEKYGTNFPERYINNGEYEELRHNNCNPIIFQMDYLFSEMRKEYIKGLIFQFNQYNNLQESEIVPVPQEIIKKDNQFLQSMKRCHVFNRIFEQVYPLETDSLLKRAETKRLSKMVDNLFASGKDKAPRAVIKNESNKFVFLLFSFDLKEIHRLFRKFYLELDKDENMIFDQNDMIDCFETFSNPEMLGIERMKNILNIIKKNTTTDAGIMSIFKEGHYSKLNFPREVYEQIFQTMQKDGQDYIDFFIFLPFLQIFFLYKETKGGIFQCFKRAGLNIKNNNSYEKCISYRMVESMIIDMRGYYQDSFGFDQMENVLRQVQQRMQVDPISLIERQKQSYGEPNKEVQSFSQWLAYIIGLQLMWSEIRKREMDFKQQSRERLAFDFQFEEKMWKLASCVDNFELKEFPAKIVEGIANRVRLREFNRRELHRKINELSGEGDPLPSSSRYNQRLNFYYIHEFTDSLTEVFQHYCPWIKYSLVERALYYYFWNLIHKSSVNYQPEASLNNSRINESFNSSLMDIPMPKNVKTDADNDLLKIFGEQFEKARAKNGRDFTNSKLFTKLTNIKFMRQIQIETDPYNLANQCDKILYQDCLRMMNEHSMKLLIEDQINYSRSQDELTTNEKLLLEGKTEDINKPNNGTGTITLQKNENDYQQDNEASKNLSGLHSSYLPTQSDNQKTDEANHMKRIKMIGLTDNKKRKQKFLKKFSGDMIEAAEEAKKKEEIKKKVIENTLKGDQEEDEEEEKRDLIGVMLTSKKLEEPLKMYDQREIDEKMVKRKQSLLNSQDKLDLNKKHFFQEANFVPEEHFNKSNKFEKIDLYKKVEKNRLHNQFEDDGHETAQPKNKYKIHTGAEILKPATNDQTFGKRNHQKNRITFEKRENSQILVDQRRLLNARKLKVQMLNEFYRNDLEFKEDDYNRSQLIYGNLLLL
ncbi:UNKNOWN [Stylonychia lemnae]|uniref:EF-hand domain-containing protein n=1 Tax=Stylonychia lemnae TaxID=5949 RepID=A0A078ANQ8_STYLE|nr:UNKNOWN [Stylonychia lemnae]|eukprot:CDW83566.1 UNKNOWN [Stylonychia lemnae]